MWRLRKLTPPPRPRLEPAAAIPPVPLPFPAVLPGPEAEPVEGQPDTVKAEGTVKVLSPFWSVSVAVAVPLGVWQVVRNNP